MARDELSDLLPLSPAALHILLSLAVEGLHGYGIMQEVRRQSAGQYRLGPGTLYDNLEKLTERGLVKEVVKSSSREDSRRRYYHLTAFGRRVLAADIKRLQAVVRDAKRHLGHTEPSKL